MKTITDFIHFTVTLVTWWVLFASIHLKLLNDRLQFASREKLAIKRIRSVLFSRDFFSWTQMCNTFYLKWLNIAFIWVIEHFIRPSDFFPLSVFSRNITNGVLIWRTEECIRRGFFIPCCGKVKSITCSFCWFFQLVIAPKRQRWAVWKSTSRGRCLSHGSKITCKN